MTVALVVVFALAAVFSAGFVAGCIYAGTSAYGDGYDQGVREHGRWQR